MSRAKRPNGSRCAWCDKVSCRAGRPLCAKARAPYLCRCAGVTWGNRENPAADQAICRDAAKDAPKPGNPPHRRGSRCGKHGVCIHNVHAAAHMWALLDTPRRKAG